MATSPIPFMSASTAAPGVVNPLTTNPTGLQGGSTTGAGAPVLGAGPGSLGATSTTSTGSPTSSSATTTLGGLLGTASGGGTTTPGITPTGDNNQTMTNNQQTQRQSDRTLGELQSYYGEGMGSYLYSLMQNGGMNMDLLNKVDTSQVAAMQPQINAGSANLNSTLGAQGVSGNSSTSALANSNYNAQAATQENAQISSNYLHEYDQGQQLLESILGGVLKTNQQGTANEGNWMDSLSGILGLGQSGTSLFSSLSNIIPGLG